MCFLLSPFLSLCVCECCVGAAFWHPYLIRLYCEIYVKPLSCSVPGVEMRTKNQQGEKESEKNAEAYLTSNSKQEKLAKHIRHCYALWPVNWLMPSVHKMAARTMADLSTRGATQQFAISCHFFFPFSRSPPSTTATIRHMVASWLYLLAAEQTRESRPWLEYKM